MSMLLAEASSRIGDSLFSRTVGRSLEKGVAQKLETGFSRMAATNSTNVAGFITRVAEQAPDEVCSTVADTFSRVCEGLGPKASKAFTELTDNFGQFMGDTVTERMEDFVKGAADGIGKGSAAVGTALASGSQAATSTTGRTAEKITERVLSRPATTQNSALVWAVGAAALALTGAAGYMFVKQNLSSHAKQALSRAVKSETEKAV